jgi:CheY-like chemotaxis protein
VRIAARSRVTVRGDTGRVQQIVWNLLTNAIKFTPRGGRVEVRVEGEGDGVARVVVRDNGQGIGPEFLPHVFERFRQADATATRRHGGLGLGLAIVRHLVEAHGGTVRAESEGPGRGSTFVVELPAAIPAPAKSTPDGDGATMPSLAGVRVLLVDDQPDAVELAHAALSAAGADVQAAHSAREAMGVLSRWLPDVLVSDIGMPDVDGYTLIREVRALPHQAGGAVPAIALTAYVQADDRVRALSAGYQLHVPKPVDLRELALAVANLAHARALRG